MSLARNARTSNYIALPNYHRTAPLRVARNTRTEATEKGPNSSIQISCESLAVRVKKLNVSSSHVVRVGFLLSSSQRPAFRSFFQMSLARNARTSNYIALPNYHRTAPLSVARNTRRLGGEGLGRKLVKVPPRKSFRHHGINCAAGQAHAKAAGRVGVLLCSAVF